MILHENQELFRQAITSTSQKFGIAEIYVEKDYWVTLVLHKIYLDKKIGKTTVFKGGTALSKCYKLIERFSEDIDLVVFKEGESANQLRNKIKAISTLVETVIPEIEREGITNKRGMIRKTAHNYPKLFQGSFGQVRSDIIVEASWLGHFEPFSSIEISSYIYEMMKDLNQFELVEEYNLKPFEVLTLDIKRTLCEKIMSLVRFSYSENPIADLNAKIRHTYDIYQLLKDEKIIDFFKSSNFDEMLLNVAEYDIISFKNNNEYLKFHPKEAKLFKEPKETWVKMVSTYNGTFKSLVYGEFPNEKEIQTTIEKVASRLQDIKWSIKFK